MNQQILAPDTGVSIGGESEGMNLALVSAS